MLNFGGLTVFVNAEDADIEIVTRIFEIIRIAPEKSHSLFWRKNDGARRRSVCSDKGDKRRLDKA